jgi:hypothetical protein
MAARHGGVPDGRAGEAVIAIDAARRTATMRFDKRYLITGPRVKRRGAVVQELSWVKTIDGWIEGG